MRTLVRAIAVVACITCLGCASRYEQSVLLPPQTTAELLATGNGPVIEIYNQGPATVESRLSGGDSSDARSLPAQVGWMRTLRNEGRIVLINRDEDQRAIVDVLVRQARRVRFTQPVVPLESDRGEDQLER